MSLNSKWHTGRTPMSLYRVIPSKYRPICHTADTYIRASGSHHSSLKLPPCTEGRVYSGNLLNKLYQTPCRNAELGTSYAHYHGQYRGDGRGDENLDKQFLHWLPIELSELIWSICTYQFSCFIEVIPLLLFDLFIDLFLDYIKLKVIIIWFG